MVDLPHPDGPSRATKAPVGASKSTLSKATTGDLATRNYLAQGPEGDPTAGRRRDQ